MTSAAPDVSPGAVGSPVRRRRRRRWTFDKISFFVVFLGVPLALFGIFVISPFTQSIYYSMTNWSGFSPEMDFVGLDNFIWLFTQEDLFLKALRNNIILLIFVPLITVVLALALATLVTVGGSSRGQIRGLRNSGVYRVVSFFPYVIPAIVVGIMWAQIYDPNAGLLNGLLTAVGLDMFDAYPWLGDARTAMGATIFVIIWGMVGFYMVLFIAAIRGIEPELFEAMRVDGAGRFSTAIHLTIPMIRGNIQTAYIYLSILALEAFTYMQALNPGGGPQNSTIVMAQVLFRTAFTDGKFGLATAMGVVLAAVTMLFAALVFLVNRLTGGEKDTAR